MFELTGAAGGQRGDPTRLLQGLVSGIGFLGAGQIIQSRGSVMGITTAAGIWVVERSASPAAAGRTFWRC